METKELYIQADADYADVLRRLITEERIRKYLRMLSADGTFPALKEAVAARKEVEAFRAAHSLKGVCLNLGLKSTADAFSSLTDALRPEASGAAPRVGREDWARIDGLFGAADDAFSKLTDLIGQLDD